MADDFKLLAHDGAEAKAAEMAIRSYLQRQFGNYSVSGAEGWIASTRPVRVSYREMALAALHAAQLAAVGVSI